MFASTISEWAQLITAIGAFLSPILLWQISRVKRVAVEVRDEVKTANSLTIANMADNTETRRIEAVLSSERSAADWEHLRSTVNPKEPK